MMNTLFEKRTSVKGMLIYKFCILLLLFFCLLPTQLFAVQHTVHVEWNYTPPNEPEIDGYNLYLDGNLACEITDTTITVFECVVNADAGTADLTLSASFADGTESPKSPAYTITIPDEIVTLPPPQPFDDIAMNFQPPDSNTPDGYLADTGNTYNSDLNYGWTTPPASMGTRDRDNPASQDQAYDTMIHVSPSAIWEIAIPNGSYEVTVCVGDASWPSGTPTVQLEAIGIIADEPLSVNNKWIEKTALVEVQDGKLTLTFTGSDPISRLCWLSITSLEPIVVPLSANFTSSTTIGYAPLSVTFDASPSSGDIISYEWNFGDGSMVNGTPVNHIYTIAGTYTAILTLRDTSGQTASKTITITAQDIPPVENVAPIAIISSSTAAGPTPLIVSFDGSQSSDSDGTIVSWKLDFGDGSTANTSTATHTYTIAGTYSTKLTVTDNQMASSNISTPVVVTTGTITNKLPTAVISTSAQQLPNPASFNFSGTTSDDSDGYIATYNWNFGDGTSATGENVNHIYTQAASYAVSLQVIDNVGGIATATTTIAVTNNNPIPLQVESGEVAINSDWHMVLFATTFTDPIVIATPLSTNDDAPATVQIRNITTKSFEIKVHEWDYLDGNHADEQISYLAIERGQHTLQNGTEIEAGTFQGTATFAQNSFETVFLEKPVLFTSVASPNEEHAVIGRLRNINTQGFEYMLQEQEANSNSHSPESVYYVAWEPGSGSDSQFTWKASLTNTEVDHNLQTITFSSGNSTIPLFLASMQTTNGSDTANIRYQSLTENSVKTQIDEEQSNDLEINHAGEVVGYLTLHPRIVAPTAFSKKINFQPLNVEIPSDYDADGGNAYDNDLGYGWISSPASYGTRDRDNSVSPDQAYDTMIHVNPSGVWEVELPSGSYKITVCVGDASWPAGTPAVQIEGNNLIADIPLNADNKWIEKTTQIDIQDGKLTLTFSGSDPITRLNWIKIEGLIEDIIEEPTSPAVDIAVNFQPSDVEIPADYLSDEGLLYDSDSGYGWVSPPASYGTRDRDNSVSPDQAYDTMIHVSPSAVWEMEIPDGTYEVTICAGDASWPTGTPAIQVEGTNIVADEPLSTDNKWIEKSTQIVVADGKITVTFTGSNPISRLCWLHIKSL